MPEDTKEQRADYIAALIEERRGVAQRDDDPERLDAIDAELSRMGRKGAPPSKRAETREEKRGHDEPKGEHAA